MSISVCCGSFTQEGEVFHTVETTSVHTPVRPVTQQAALPSYGGVTNKQTKGGGGNLHCIVTQRFRLSFHLSVITKQAVKIMCFTSPNLWQVQLQHLSHIHAGEEKQWCCCFYILFLPKTAPMDGGGCCTENVRYTKSPLCNLDL